MNSKMNAVAMAMAMATLLLASNVANAEPRKHFVGDSSGWSSNRNPQINYTAWSMKEVFYAGDELVFIYDPKQENVVEVDRRSYLHCTVEGTISHHQDGNTSIRLSRPGPHFYLCSTRGHCQQGERFVAMVLPAPPPTPPKSSPAPTATAAPAPHHSHRHRAPAPAPTSDALAAAKLFSAAAGAAAAAAAAVALL